MYTHCLVMRNDGYHFPPVNEEVMWLIMCECLSFHVTKWTAVIKAIIMFEQCSIGTDKHSFIEIAGKMMSINQTWDQSLPIVACMQF